MAVGTMKYFDGATELFQAHPIPNAKFVELFGDVKIKGPRYDDFSKLAGLDADGELHPVRRQVYYRNRPSLHECNGRCMGATGQNCECKCGGANHGINS